ncbi:V-set domain-containing T-cell activation inhibitor 1-like [Xenopus laevis]|uniref:Ig-like domain-containing protein n=2 Tax=Xenopus laevis TaxID=8355 RepID=A0A974HX09_XENLA|nr:V-set domain-containing T-cell activation inhibitor 1-like [Xenopus laevis]OCT93557.1 hypothetical protein XELAEV_18011235mg [Xenopus laevis]
MVTLTRGHSQFSDFHQRKWWIFLGSVALVIILVTGLSVGLITNADKQQIRVSTERYVVKKMMEDVILSCTFTPDPSQDYDIKWEKVGMSGLVHKYQKGNNELTDQNPAFRGRTSLFLSQVMVGNASLKLSRVQLSDTGTYRCIISNSKGNGMDSLTLNVGGYSHVTVTQISSRSLRCESPDWYPQPSVSWDASFGPNIQNFTNTSYRPTHDNMVNVSTELSDAQGNIWYNCEIRTGLAVATATSIFIGNGIRTKNWLTVVIPASGGPSSVAQVWLCVLLLCLTLGSLSH